MRGSAAVVQPMVSDDAERPPVQNLLRAPAKRPLLPDGASPAARLEEHPPDVRLIDHIGAARAVREGVLPWYRAGALTVVAVTTPRAAEGQRNTLEAIFGQVSFARISQDALEAALLPLRRGSLAARAEDRTAPHLSCRGLAGARLLPIAAVTALSLVACVILAPVETFALLVLWTSAWLFASTCLRLAAAVVAGRATPAVPLSEPAKLPVVSCLVPLFRERDIAGELVCRLSGLDYPPHRLEICLIVEKHDAITRAALAKVELPDGMRVIVVPPGSLQTKPRALNYALDFTRGEIIGIYDAEDKPAVDQLRKVAAHFAAAQPDVACLQGRLDFYNPATNWLSRCFTIDYAVWFRVVLPGLSRLRLAVPLGGTTLFFRRDVLERLGGWDAHNVTEDADLGVRLARHGWRTELIPTVTEEEANCRLWPWIKQRSRWIKGYAMTWAVHMRRPLVLLGDLGPWRFFGFQIVFLGSLSQFVLAPLLWSFWLVFFGLPHPLADRLPDLLVLVLATLFLTSEVVNIGIGAWACRGPSHRWLIPWVPTVHFYFPLASVASWKGLGEIVSKPFFWDKTDHGTAPRPTNA